MIADGKSSNDTARENYQYMSFFTKKRYTPVERAEIILKITPLL